MIVCHPAANFHHLRVRCRCKHTVSKARLCQQGHSNIRRGKAFVGGLYAQDWRGGLISDDEMTATDVIFATCGHMCSN